MGKPDQPRGPDGKYGRRPATAVVAAAGLAGLVAYGPIGTSGGGVASVESSVGQALRSKLDMGKRSAAKGRRGTTWRQLDLKRVRRTIERGAQCALNSYGDVQRFFLRTPCRTLDRILVALDDQDGNRIAVSVSWVRMRGATAARNLRDLADTDGTGNVAPLPPVVVGAERIRWTGENYDSRRAGALVVIAEVEPLGGSPEAAFMDGVAEVAVRFPAP